MTKDFSDLFTSPTSYSPSEQHFHAAELYEQFSKRVLFRIKAGPSNRYGLTPPNGLLVYGPPANGKSVLVRQFAQMTGLPYAVVNRYDLLDGSGGHTNGSFKALMSAAERLAPCVLILENIETVVPERKKLRDCGEYVDVMANLSLLRDCGGRGVYVFATTSKPRDVDAQIGMSGYLNELLYASFPAEAQRLYIVRQLLALRPCQGDIDYARIVKESVDFTIGDLVALVDEMALSAATDHTDISNMLVQHIIPIR